MAADPKSLRTQGKGGTEGGPPRIMRPFEEFERLFEELVSRPWLQPGQGRLSELHLPFQGRMPRLDVIDRDSEVVVRAEVPGARKEDIEVSVNGNLFTIRGHVEREEEEEKGDYYRCETTRGSFARTVALPAEVDESGARAELKEGCLEVTLPKAERARKRSIQIQ